MKDHITTAMVDEVFRRETQKLDSVSRFKGLLTESASCEGTSEYMEGAVEDVKEKIADMLNRCGDEFSKLKKKETEPLFQRLRHVTPEDIKDVTEKKVVKPICDTIEKKKKALKRAWKKTQKKLAKEDCETIMKDYGGQIAAATAAVVAVGALTVAGVKAVADASENEVNDILSDYSGFAKDLANDVKSASDESAKEVAEAARDFQKAYEKLVDDQIKAVKEELSSYTK